MFIFYACILMFLLRWEMWVGYIGIRCFFVMYVTLHKNFLYRYFSNGLNTLRFIFYIGSMQCDVSYNIRQFATLFDAMLKCFSPRYVKLIYNVLLFYASYFAFVLLNSMLNNTAYLTYFDVCCLATRM